MLTKKEDHAWTRPALLQRKLRHLELEAGHASHRGGNKPAPASDYSLQVVRDKERAWLGLAEEEYRRFVAGWRDQPPGKQNRARCQNLAADAAIGKTRRCYRVLWTMPGRAHPIKAIRRRRA